MKVHTFTFIIASSFSLLFGACDDHKRPEPPSGFIPVDTANLMISSYLESINSDTTADTPAEDLHSLIMDADELRAYLDDNPDIIKVKFIFAHTLDYIHKGKRGQNAGYKSKELTLIVAGYDKMGNYVLSPGGVVPNHCAPCPDFCPKKGTATGDLLQ